MSKQYFIKIHTFIKTREEEKLSLEKGKQVKNGESWPKLRTSLRHCTSMPDVNTDAVYTSSAILSSVKAHKF
jgi:hypothetical protein